MTAKSLFTRPSIVATVGLLGGFTVARYTGHREAGGAVFAAAGAWCGREWTRSGGPVVGSVMSALYTGAMGGSHPLAKKVGAWKSVLAVTAVTVVASEVVTHRG